MDEYVENKDLPSRIEQKYSWSCRICTTKEVINSLLKTNISEDDILSRIENIVYYGKAPPLSIEDKGPAEFVKRGEDLDSFCYIALDPVIRNFLRNEFLLVYDFERRCDLIIRPIKIEEKDGSALIEPDRRSYLKRTVDEETYRELNYQIIKEVLQDKGAVIASGYRREINGFNENAMHHFIIKGIGKDGQRMAKVVDCNYKRRNLEPEYFVPLDLLTIDDIYVPKEIG